MSRQDAHSEETPLVAKAADKNREDEKGQATVVETILNLCKTCCGTGCLALPFGAQEGGVMVFVFGLLFLGLWNLYAVERLVRCRSYLAEAIRKDEEEVEAAPARAATTTEESAAHQRVKFPPESTSTLGKVAFFAFGPVGLEVMDILMTILLLGIVISYLSAVISFISDTPLTIGPLGDALAIASLMALLSLVPDMGHLSGISGAGLLVLAGAFVVIAGYGLCDFFQTPPDVSLPLWPVSAVGLSHFFGVCVFGFGGTFRRPNYVRICVYMYTFHLTSTCSCSVDIQLSRIDEETGLDNTNHCRSVGLCGSFLRRPRCWTFDLIPGRHGRDLA